MKKHVLTGCAVVVLFFCLSAGPSMAADKCVLWGFKWEETMSDYGYNYAWLLEDGTFVTSSGAMGSWSDFGNSRGLLFWGDLEDAGDGCEPLYAGSKKQGFMTCRDGQAYIGTWIMKGTPKKNCLAYVPLVTATDVQAGPSLVKPR